MNSINPRPSTLRPIAMRVLAPMRVLALVGVALLLTGCQTTLTTTIRASGDKVNGSFTVLLEDEAAKALLSDPSTDQQLLQLLTDRTGSTVVREESDRSVVYRSGLPTEKAFSTVNGVEVVSVERSRSDSVVKVRLTRPADLLAALESSTTGEVDSAARFLVLQRTTRICAEVVFDGSVNEVTSTGPVEITRDGRSVIGCASLSDLQAGDATVDVTGDTTRNVLPVALGVIMVIVICVVSYRRWLSK